MSGFLEFVKAWAKLIGDVFGQYPFAAAIITLLVFAAFYAYERHAKSENWPTLTFRFLIALIGWAILVPILGWIFNRIEEVWSLVKFVASGLASFGLFLYQAYATHPILVLVLAAISTVAFVVWHRLRPMSPSWPLKAIACIAMFAVGVAITKPIANLFAPSSVTNTESKPSTPATGSSSAPARAPASAPAPATSAP
jgi:hypothetical protein